MEIDKDIIIKMIKDFVYYNPKYDNLSFIDTFSATKSAITDVVLRDMKFIDNEPYDVADMYGNRYIKGMGGWIDAWVDIFYTGGTRKAQYLRIFYRNYLSEERDKKLSKMNLTLVDKVKNKIDEYLEFDSSDIFRDDYKLIRIFGGAVRDSICGDEINDIDILCGSKSFKFLENLLSYNGYHYMESLVPKDLSSVYTDIHIISEPHTWIKDTKIVQIIRPSLGVSDKDMNSVVYRDGFLDLIANVDISCCGLSYDSKRIYEDFPNAIIHSQSKVFFVNSKAKMYSHKRIHHRIGKFEDRGWTKIENNEACINRDLKIEKVFNGQG